MGWESWEELADSISPSAMSVADFADLLVFSSYPFEFFDAEILEGFIGDSVVDVPASEAARSSKRMLMPSSEVQ